MCFGPRTRQLCLLLLTLESSFKAFSKKTAKHFSMHINKLSRCCKGQPSGTYSGRKCDIKANKNFQ